MPSNATSSTVLRYLQILQLLSGNRTGTGLSTREIYTQLCDAGYSVDIRTVQRDMKVLEETFKGVLFRQEDEGEKQARWTKSRYLALETAAISLADSLTLELVHNSLRTLFPPELLKELEPRFAAARNTINHQVDANRYAAWGNKVRSILPVLPMQLPQIGHGVLECVQTCLLQDEQIEIEYQGWRPGEVKTLTLHPQALIQSGTVTYLIALTFSYNDVVMYALHRIATARRLFLAARHAEDFNIDDYIAAGHMQYGNRSVTGESVRIRLRVVHWMQRILAETALSEDQSVQEDPQDSHLDDIQDRHFLVTASVFDTLQLQSWLLGFGPALEVLAPAFLRERIGRLHGAATAAYA